MRLFGIIVVLSLMSVACWGTTLYTNGAISGAIGGAMINGGFEVSDSFVLSSDSFVTGVSNIGLWVYTPDVPETVDWVISTAPDGGGTVEAFGAGSSLATSFFETVGNRDIYSSSFSTGSVALSAGTYYLELLNATSAGSGAVFWDVNGGSAAADTNGGPITSEAFQVDGIAPEPTSVVLSGLGLMALAGIARLRRRQFQS
jgi:MYXO-CTERM domain-containing protein